MFACVPCALCFDSSEEQVKHLKSEFHYFNLKRRVAGEAPILEHEFDFKQQLLKEANEPLKVVVEKHVSKPKESPREFRPTCSLFCSHESATVEENLTFMKENYGFEIADEKYCVDREGLLEVLGEAVYQDFRCIYCDREFLGFENVLRHMSDTGHRRMGMLFEEQLQDYAAYYDFSKSYLELNLPQNVLDEIAALEKDEWEMVEDMAEEQSDAAPNPGGFLIVAPEEGPSASSEKLRTQKQIQELVDQYRPHRTADGGLAVPTRNLVLQTKAQARAARSEQLVPSSRPQPQRLRVAIQDRRGDLVLSKDQQRLLIKIRAQIQYNKNAKAHLDRANHHPHIRKKKIYAV